MSGARGRFYVFGIIKVMADYLQFITRKPYLAWDVASPNQLSEKSVLERIYNYGDWQDYLEIESILGLTKTAEIFKSLVSQTRTNLRPQTINYFQHYYQKYAS